MATVTFIEHNGTEHTIEATEGDSLMEAAVHNDVPGIDADCGGACACATCHVFVEPEWTALTGPTNSMEESMLNLADGRRENSRLACQIVVNGDLDGLRVSTPESQH